MQSLFDGAICGSDRCQPGEAMTLLTVPKVGRDPVLVLILLGALGLNTHRLGRPGLHYFDESFHAIVARNLLKHPLTPTLIDVPYLPADPTRWSESHVWLHKPVLPLWTIAASFGCLGVNTLALRLPSALLATGAVGLTGLIGRALFDRRTGLIAAGLQAINPVITMLVQGSLFSDHIDVALLFWVEVGAYFLIRAARSGSWGDVGAVGVAQGLAYLSKSYLAALLTGLAVVLWLLPRVGLVAWDDSKLRGRHLLGLLGATLATAAPWMIHCWWRFPVEFEHEHGYVFAHLGQGVEGWGGPWDRVVFDYLIQLYHAFYPALIVAALVLPGSAGRDRRLALWFLFGWLGGVLAPHLASATKTPSATLIALPAGLLLLAHLIAEGWRGERRALAGWAAVVVVGVVRPATIGRFGRGYPDPPSPLGVMLQASWVLEHLAVGFAVVGAFEVVERLRRREPKGDAPPSRDRWTRRVRCVALAATLILAARVMLAAWLVTEGGEGQPFVAELARRAGDRLPANAVLLFDGPDRGEHHLAMFLLDRTCYPLRGQPADEVARRIARAGGKPFVITTTTGATLWPRWFVGSGDPRGLFEWRDRSDPTATRQTARLPDTSSL